MTARYLIGDVFERMAELPDGSVDLIMCSPPFLALRSYLPADHPDKAKEIGSEASPAAFVDTLLRLTVEWRRLLAPHGSICVELGDTYAGSGQGPDDRRAAGAIEGGRRIPSAGWPLAKSLCLIPELYRIGLVYGINPLTGQPSPAGRWRARNVVRWHRPNPPVGALGDKFRPATSDMVIACVGGKRYFDLDAVRSGEQTKPGGSTNWHPHDGRDNRGYEELGGKLNTGSHPAGAPPLDTWIISTEPFKGSHYATWPRDLCVKPILAMCPQRVCLECGAPSTRIVETSYVTDNSGGTAATKRDAREPDGNTRGLNGDAPRLAVANTTMGWSDCGHDSWRLGLVLDPFAGSGTTLAVATGLGRDALGIDLDERNQWLARERIGMLLEDQP